MTMFSLWFDKLPQGWKSSKISYAFRTISSGTTPGSGSIDYYGGDVPWVTTSELRENLILVANKKITREALRDHSALKLYPPGTLLIAMYGATIGRIGILGVSATTNQACCALASPSGITVRFAFYLLVAARQYIIGLATGGGQPNVNQELIRSLRVPLPPLADQHAIVAFLDHETTKIDALIARQAEFLTRLDERRRVHVTEVVSLGLDSAATRKVTGVPTFPLIPAHWQIGPLMHLVPSTRPINYGVLMPGPRLSDGVPLIEAGDIMAGPINPNEIRRTAPEIELPFARSRLKAGDVVVAIRGSVGAAQVVPEALTNANVTRDAARVSPLSDTDSRFLAYVLGSDALRDYYASQSLGAAVQGINISDLKRVPIPRPPLAEQKSIAAYLDARLDQLNKARGCGERMIATLTERRLALISAAVTGQINVTQPALTENAA